MTAFLKKYKKEIVLGVLIIVAYLVTRLVNLGIIPIFTDEAIYLRWSQIMAYDAGLRYLPLVDGKPPLFMWLTSFVMRLLPQIDVLLTGRLVSVVAGLGSLIGIYVVSYQLFHNKKISFFSSLFYLLSPFTFFYDRFGLADGLLAMFALWSLSLAIFLAQTARLDVAMILGLVIGFGLLTKSPALFFFLLLPLTIFIGKFRWKLILLFLVVIVFAESIYSVLRLFPLFSMINQKNHEFILTFSQFFQNPWQNFANLRTLTIWEITYLTIPVVLLIPLAFKKYSRLSLILSSLFLIQMIYMALFNKVIYPRFLLTFTPYLLILAAAGLSLFKQKIIWLAVFIFPVFIIFKLIFNPVNAPLIQADRDQYLDGWAAGFGVAEIRGYLKNKKGVLATEGTFGLMPYALELYKKDYPDLEIKPYWPLPATAPARTNYLLMYQNQKEPLGWKLQEIMRFRQGKGENYLRLYAVLSNYNSGIGGFSPTL